MPFIMAYPVISFLRRRAYAKQQGDRAADERDELAPLHSITSSARASSDGGTVRPSALAVGRLITSSSLVGNSNGRVPGLAAFRRLSALSAVPRKFFDMSIP